METAPTFSTKRLHVWEITTPDDLDGDGSHGRVLFVAIVRRTFIDWPGVAVSASVWPAYGCEVDWIQTSDAMRKHGLGEELLRAIKERMGAIHLTPVSDSGEKLAKRMSRKKKGATTP